MKIKILLCLLFALMFSSVMSQAPNAFKYQAVIRDTSGIPMSEKAISLRISIIKGDIYGDEVYAEHHNVLSDKLGLVNLNIGQGLDASSEFSGIPWGEDSFFVKIEIAMDGGMDYHLLGISKLLAVPYALYAASSGENLWNECNEGIYYDEGKVGIGTQVSTGMLAVEHPAQSPEGEKQEVIFEGKVSDAPDDFIKVYNGTDYDRQFIPAVWGHHQSDKRIAFGLIGTIDSTMDYGIEPVTVFASRIYNGDWDWQDVQNRPLFSWRKLYDDKMTMLANGYLGLGTTTPSTLFHISGYSVDKEDRYLLTLENKSDNDESSAIMKIKAGNDSSSTILLHTAESYNWQGRSKMGMLGNDGNGIILAATDEFGEIRFETGGAGIEKERMRITEIGRVGIGTSDPGSTLDIAGNNIELADYVFLGRMYSGTDLLLGHNIKAIDYENTRGAYVANNWPLGYSGIRMYNGTIQFHAKGGYVYAGELASNEIMRINSYGCVGIGTSNPASKLHIYVLDSSELFKLEGYNPSIIMSDVNDSKTWQINSDNHNNKNNFRILEDGNEDMARLYIAEGGNVGIGTVTPARNLHVKDILRLEPRQDPPNNPSEGDIYMDGNDHVLKVYNGTEWKSCW